MVVQRAVVRRLKVYNQVIFTIDKCCGVGVGVGGAEGGGCKKVKSL